ncbi:MAG: SIMPL domain-containing protein [Bacteroidales bacterium]|nr:SIMPL domain-containing protein [Bacteroidales bacterium]MDD3667285.1 SIMPL domain-containing protein [Bacteroidales bacterium]
MEKNKQLSIIIIGICVSISLLFVGFFIYKGLKTFSDKERVVSVRGLSEMIVDADYANLKIKYTEGDNDMQSLLNKIEDNNNKIVSFIKYNGLTDSEINLGVPVIKDKKNTEYNNNYSSNSLRYYCEETITIQSNKVENVRKIELSQFDLYKQGITLSQSSYEYEGDSKYTFTKLNDIKPKMIEESTNNARIAGEQFSKNSKSKLGGIKSAYQGQFEITPTENPLKLKVRVVSSISYFLND